MRSTLSATPKWAKIADGLAWLMRHNQLPQFAIRQGADPAGYFSLEDRPVRIIFTSLTLTLMFAHAVSSQDSGSHEAAKKRAQEILKQAREALGGEANLSALKSLQAQGNFKGAMFGRGVQGNFKIELLQCAGPSNTALMNRNCVISA
jgi:hypothetical protein